MSEEHTIKLTLAYDGAPFAGWQRQTNARAVQQVVEEALSDLHDVDVVLHGAGRTDAGVHALGQVAHVALRDPASSAFRDLPLEAWLHATNHRLPSEVRVLRAERVPTSFHARKSAVGKRYAYRIAEGEVVAPLDAPRVFHSRSRLDLGAMVRAAADLPGLRDFGAFALAGGSHTQSVRRLFSARVERSVGRPGRASEIRVELWGAGFLRGMVRSIAGTLLEIGRGERPADDIARLLEPGRRREEAGFTADARGLCLERVVYGPQWRALQSYPDPGVGS